MFRLKRHQRSLGRFVTPQPHHHLSRPDQVPQRQHEQRNLGPKPIKPGLIHRHRQRLYGPLPLKRDRLSPHRQLPLLFHQHKGIRRA
jgi:hypothetical protein